MNEFKNTRYERNLIMTHSQKIKADKAYQNQILLMLDILGLTSIINLQGSNYEVIINYEITAVFKTRRSAKRFLVHTLKHRISELRGY